MINPVKSSPPSENSATKVSFNDTPTVLLIQKKEEYYKIDKDGNPTSTKTNSMAYLIWDKSISNATPRQLESERCIVRDTVRDAIAAGKSIEETIFPPSTEGEN